MVASSFECSPSLPLSTGYVLIRGAARVRSLVRSRDHRTSPPSASSLLEGAEKVDPGRGKQNTVSPSPSLPLSLLAAVCSIAQERQRMGSGEGGGEGEGRGDPL